MVSHPNTFSGRLAPNWSQTQSIGSAVFVWIKKNTPTLKWYHAIITYSPDALITDICNCTTLIELVDMRNLKSVTRDRIAFRPVPSEDLKKRRNARAIAGSGLVGIKSPGTHSVCRPLHNTRHYGLYLDQKRMKK